MACNFKFLWQIKINYEEKEKIFYLAIEEKFSLYPNVQSNNKFKLIRILFSKTKDSRVQVRKIAFHAS
jgi:hypothetical protein